MLQNGSSFSLEQQTYIAALGQFNHCCPSISAREMFILRCLRSLRMLSVYLLLGRPPLGEHLYSILTVLLSSIFRSWPEMEGPEKKGLLPCILMKEVMLRWSHAGQKCLFSVWSEINLFGLINVWNILNFVDWLSILLLHILSKAKYELFATAALPLISSFPSASSRRVAPSNWKLETATKSPNT